MPLAPGAAGLPETRVLRSEVIDARNAAGRARGAVRGDARAPGVIEFLPNRPGQRRRRLDGERISVAYGAGNRIRALPATNAATRTEYPPPAGKPAPPVMLTWSKDLKAEFDPVKSELTSLEQWNDFRYEQGDRKGRAERASLDQAGPDHARGAARLWDPSGTLSADHILTDQNNGDVDGRRTRGFHARAGAREEADGQCFRKASPSMPRRLA